MSRTPTRLPMHAGLALAWAATFAPLWAQVAPLPEPDQKTTADVAAPAPATVQPAAPAQLASPTQPAPHPGTAAEPELTPSNGPIMLNFRQAPLDAVLDHLSKAAGFVVVKEASTDGLVDVWSHQPLTADEAVALLNTVLSAKGLAAVRTDRTLRIVPQAQAATYDLPVRTGADPEEIPKGDAMVTQVIPVRHADAAKMLENLKPLLASYASMSANQSSNTIIITDTQTRVRRIVSIIQALDTSIASVTEIRVFPLENGDAEEVAKLISSVFETPAETRQNNQSRDRMRQIFMRMRGGRGEDNGGPDTGEDGGRVASMTVKAVAEPNSNSVVVNAPSDMMDDIGRLIAQIDIAAEDLVQLRVFPCRYADAASVAQSITQLFASGTTSSTSSRFGSRFSRFGMGPPGSGGGGSAATGTTSERKTKEAEVKATSDERTNSVIVTASGKTMALIETMITELDSSPRNVSQVYVYHIEHADLEALQETLQNMFDQIEDGGSSSSSNRSTTGASTGSSRTSSTTQRSQPTGSSSRSGQGR